MIALNKKRLCAVTALIMAISIVFGINVNAVTIDDSTQIPYNSYTYWNEYSASNKIAVYNKPMYEVSQTINYIDMGLTEQFSKLTDVFSAQNGKTYILDGGASKIVVLNEKYNLLTEIKEIVSESTVYNFKDAQGIFVDSNSNIYIADTQNEQVLVCDENGSFLKKYTLPDSRLIPSNFKFKPIKLSKDSRGYFYILCDGSYNGAILYSPEDKFLGFYGANTVKKTITQALTTLWKKITMTDEKRSVSATMLPFQFTDLFIDKNDFVYTATGATAANQTGQLKKLSPGGKDVLGSESVNFADAGSKTLKQDLLSLSVDDEGYIYALDSAYGHIFIYDKNKNLLSVFGCGSRNGTQDGSFTSAVAITLNNNDVLVADSSLNTVSIFKITDYGLLLKEAQRLTDKGDYTGAKDLWIDIMSQDKNNQLAYIGLAKSYYDEGDYQKAMEYAKIGCDRKTYALAFELVRNDWITDNFTYIVLIAVTVIVLLIIGVYYKRKKNIVFLNEKLRLMFSVMRHPGDTFYKIRTEKKNSVLISILLLLLFYATTVIKTTSGGFCFVYFNSSSYNALFVLLQTVGLILLFGICFWGVSTLMQGQGKIGEIITVLCYSLQPVIISNIVYVILTNILVPGEIGFLNLFMTIMVGYSAFLMIRGLMYINDYGFGKLIGVTVLSIAGMVIVLFVCIAVMLLLQLLWGFIRTVYAECYKIISFGG